MFVLPAIVINRVAFMPIRFLALCLCGCLLMLTACQTAPPTQTVIMITRVVTVEVIVTATPREAEGFTVDAGPPTTQPNAAAPPPAVLPTVTEGEISVAEQRFENGWMLWLEPIEQIWVIFINDSGEYIWEAYDDTFAEGEIESDPQIVPPEGLVQPIRGFGKLWRGNPEVRAALGWALDDEFGHNTLYKYHPGGAVSENGDYQPGPGHHLVESLYGDLFRLSEADSTWQIEE